MIQFANPEMSADMVCEAVQALVNEKWTSGDSCTKFEEEFAKFIGAKHAVAVNNGTSALILAQMALGLKYAGIITTPMTFIATANSAVFANNCPVFLDITADLALNLESAWNPEYVAGKKAVLPVNLYGHRSNLKEVRTFCDEFHLSMIEDNCQWHWKGAGIVGDAACYSFYPTKNITVAGDGGMVLTNNEEVASKIRKIANCGRKSSTEHDVFGITARMNTVNAAVGRVQLRKLDGWNHRRAQLAELYHRNLDGLDHIKLTKGGNDSCWHLYTIRCERRNELKAALEKDGIQTGIHYPHPVHLQEIYAKTYGYKRGMYPVAEEYADTTLSLPMYPSLTGDEVKMACESVRRFYG